ncbi:proton-conducting transporter transmembrane domain-containing protein [Parvularcula lutaonensis]|uniref:Proton-conducting transporter membrane subunit n=1 Tax=Parvularcula lutaonensis TaxID=491923 RepID=A0ABV7MF20_9PROT|nr:proton-conducting transporter membrane subunit [Parvularcula lutaonensis]GGY52909.1 oxidoreductase [Parvularcula lutaonensis]
MPDGLAPIALLTLLSSLLASSLVQLFRLALNRSKSEAATFRMTVSGLLGAAASVIALSFILATSGPQRIDAGHWFHQGNYDFAMLFVVDSVAVTYGFISVGLLLLIAAFSRRYLHKEAGFHRFYLFLTLFGLGLITVSFAGTLEILTIGWEIVGLLSVLLIAFFTTRPKPAKNALRAFVTYRLGDVGLITAALILHHLHAAGFTILEGRSWFGIGEGSASIGYLLLLAAAAKSALFPVSGWLPRAMEGPTPSSAVFYGALSVHLGPLLLIRAGGIIEANPGVAAAIVAIGLVTAVLGRMVGQVQTDVKSRLAYGSITQLGIIVAEVGLGLHVLALVHIGAHAAVRTLQILRAPSLLHEHQHLEQMLGHPLRSEPSAETPGPFARWRYAFSLERGGLDTLLRDRVVFGVLGLVGRLDRLDARAADRLMGSQTSRPSHPPVSGTVQ